MKQLIDAQELARRNNENAAVYAVVRFRRALRRRFPLKEGLTRREHDYLDWLEANREFYGTRAVGQFAQTSRRLNLGEVDAQSS